jgi:KipI family sensor histidine kinase inhibitor
VKVEIVPYGEAAALVQFEQKVDPVVNDCVLGLAHQIEHKEMNGIREVIPAYASLLIVFDPVVISFPLLKEKTEKVLSTQSEVSKGSGKVVSLPVCYEKNYATDLNSVTQKTGISKKEIVRIHHSVDYRVYMLGFVPGFLYLGGMDERIACPRKQTPRTKIPKGAVGIAGSQTGVYPLETPGGWQVIGQCPVSLFDPNDDFAIQPGDTVRFYPITSSEFQSLSET